jgi:hypothetical protein
VNELRSTRPACIGLLTAALSIAGCAGDRVIVAEETILERQIEGLTTLIERTARGPLRSSRGIVVAVDEVWAGEMISLALPWTRIIEEQIRVQIESAEVTFDDGLGLVALRGRASSVAAPPDDVFADVTLFASFDDIELDARTGVLRARLVPIAFEVRRASVYVATPIAQRLLEQLGRERIGAFDSFAVPIEFPVRVEHVIELPEVGPDGPIAFAGATIPLEFAVSDVMSVSGRLWVSVSAQVLPLEFSP